MFFLSTSFPYCALAMAGTDIITNAAAINDFIFRMDLYLKAFHTFTTFALHRIAQNLTLIQTPKQVQMFPHCDVTLRRMQHAA